MTEAAIRQTSKRLRILKGHKFVTYPPQKRERRSVLQLRLNGKFNSRPTLQKQGEGARGKKPNYQADNIGTKINYSHFISLV